jgi:CubicO group peptidase (beta-lactamase class C family)
MTHKLAAALAATILLAGLLAGSAHAGSAPPPTAQSKRIVQAFKDWAARWSVPNGSIVVMQGDKLLGSGDIGTYKAKKIEPVASLSKAITAICVTQLVESGALQYTTPLSSVLKTYLHKNPPADARAKTITIGELLTHSSGITYDPSQGNQGGAIEALPHNKTNLDKQAAITLSQDLGGAPGGAYVYNNMNYAILGLVIETVTGKDYETQCGGSVLAPVGVKDAKLLPGWQLLSSWGGWDISSEDYAKFLAYYLPSEGLLSIPPSQWPQFDLGGGAFYSLGTLMRQAGTGYNFWHTGSFQWSPPASSFGSYFAVLQEDVRYEADFAPTVSDDAFSDLDASLYNAATATDAVPGPAKASPMLLPH